MSKRAQSSGIVLNANDARLVKGMILRGDRQHDIAAWFGVNGGRIGEIATGARFSWVDAAPSDELPPPGPYPAARVAIEAIAALKKAKAALASAEALILQPKL